MSITIKNVHSKLKGKGLTISQRMKLVCGKRIGRGLYRDVFIFKHDPNYVVKVERDQSTAQFANVTEWRNYIDNKEWKWFAKYLAPCEYISVDGRILIQRRVEHRDHKEYPKEIPAMFCDVKYQNFGWIGKQFVCCDYSFIPFYIVSVGKSKYKRAKWWDHTAKPKKRHGRM